MCYGQGSIPLSESTFTPKWPIAKYLKFLSRCRRCLEISSIGWPDDGEYYAALVVGFILRSNEVIHTVFYLNCPSVHRTAERREQTGAPRVQVFVSSYRGEGIGISVRTIRCEVPSDFLLNHRFR